MSYRKHRPRHELRQAFDGLTALRYMQMQGELDQEQQDELVNAANLAFFHGLGAGASRRQQMRVMDHATRVQETVAQMTEFGGYCVEKAMESQGVEV